MRKTMISFSLTIAAAALVSCGSSKPCYTGSDGNAYFEGMRQAAP